MYLLGIETATTTGSLALMSDDKLISEYTLNVRTTHNTRLMPVLDQMLRDSSIDKSQLNGIAVSIGPGSFTGLRIGLATAKGLAMGLDIPLIGVPTLDALARNVTYSRYQICPILDARKKEIYVSIFSYENDEIIRKLPYMVMPPDNLVEYIMEKTVFIGDGLNVYRQIIDDNLEHFALFAPNTHNLPRAAMIAEMGLQKLKAGECMDLASAEPIYIRPSDAEMSVRQ